MHYFLWGRLRAGHIEAVGWRVGQWAIAVPWTIQCGLSVLISPMANFFPSISSLTEYKRINKLCCVAFRALLRQLRTHFPLLVVKFFANGRCFIYFFLSYLLRQVNILILLFLTWSRDLVVAMQITCCILV